MKVAGIIAEYNPFHNGHAFQIEKTKEQGITHIVAVMSGNFTQRGDIACFSKWARAKAALHNGVDLVVELPTMYALSSAKTFAYAGVSICNELGVDAVSFGSECGDIALLTQTAHAVAKSLEHPTFKLSLANGVSYPRALEQTVSALYGKQYADILQTANNALGIEYLRAIQEINASITPMTVMREQVHHDSKQAGDTIASASYLREFIWGKEIVCCKPYVPESAYEIYKEETQNGFSPIRLDALELLLLQALRSMSIEQFQKLPDVSEGLENRLYQAAKQAVSLQQFYELVKTKRYTLARIRRIAFCALLGITKEMQAIPPQYIRVLACNKKGMEILRRAKMSATIPIETKFAKLAIRKLHGLTADIKATDMYSLLQPNTRPCNLDYYTNAIILK
jgi:predicted nucleotidyltransferase